MCRWLKAAKISLYLSWYESSLFDLWKAFQTYVLIWHCGHWLYSQSVWSSDVVWWVAYLSSIPPTLELQKLLPSSFTSHETMSFAVVIQFNKWSIQWITPQDPFHPSLLCILWSLLEQGMTQGEEGEEDQETESTSKWAGDTHARHLTQMDCSHFGCCTQKQSLMMKLSTVNFPFANANGSAAKENWVTYSRFLLADCS